MNPICERSAKADLVRISGKPNPPKSKAIKGRMPVVMLQNIDPQATPAKSYVKKVK